MLDALAPDLVRVVALHVPLKIALKLTCRALRDALPHRPRTDVRDACSTLALIEWVVDGLGFDPTRGQCRKDDDYSDAGYMDCRAGGRGYVRRPASVWLQKSWAITRGQPHDASVPYSTYPKAGRGPRMCMIAATDGGGVPVLAFLRERGAHWDARTHAAAVRAGADGDTDALRFLCAHGCPRDEGVIASAACRNDVVLMHWLRANGYPLCIDRVLSAAVVSGSPDAMTWALRERQEGRRWLRQHVKRDDPAPADASEFAEMKREGCGWPPLSKREARYAMRLAVRHGQLGMVDYVASLGDAWRASPAERAAKPWQTLVEDALATGSVCDVAMLERLVALEADRPLRVRALIAAVERGELPLVQWLFARLAADPARRLLHPHGLGEEGADLALATAVHYGRRSAFEWLVARGLRPGRQTAERIASSPIWRSGGGDDDAPSGARGARVTARIARS